MRALVRISVLLVLAALVLAACGGGSSGNPSSAASAEASSGTPSSQPSEAASAEPSAEPSTGGGTAAGVCDLVTADELADIFGVASVTTTVLAGPPDNCIVKSDTGDPLTAWSLTLTQAQAIYSALTSDPSTIEVSGIGDKAAIVENTGLLVLKGNALLVVNISGGADMTEDEVLEATKQIGTIAAGRM